jgi:hypothetical protein
MVDPFLFTALDPKIKEVRAECRTSSVDMSCGSGCNAQGREFGFHRLDLGLQIHQVLFKSLDVFFPGQVDFRLLVRTATSTTAATCT